MAFVFLSLCIKKASMIPEKPNSTKKKTGQEPALAEFAESFWNARKLIHKNLPNESELAFRKAAEKARANDLEAEALVADAALFEIKGKHEEAIRCLKLALRNSSFQLPGMAHFILGSVYKERFQDELNKAIDHYQKAISDDHFDKKAWAHNNLGNIYFRQAGFAKHPDGAADLGGGEGKEKQDAEDLYAKAAASYESSLAFIRPG